MKTLSKKPSELIRQANKAGRSLNRKEYKPYSHVFHSGARYRNGRLQKPCEVCYAGAVMGAILGVDKELYMTPDDLAHDARNQLFALDNFRMSNWGEGFWNLKLKFPEELEGEMKDPDWSFDTWQRFDKFMRIMEYNAKVLEAAGF